MQDDPFDSIESAHRFVHLLAARVPEVQASLAEDRARAEADGASRNLQALQLVEYKLLQLERHLVASGRILNDLRALRRLLLGVKV